MRYFNHIGSGLYVTIIFLVLATNLYAQNSQLLSAAIKDMIDVKGVEETKMYFAGLSASEKGNYTVDMPGIVSLATEYSQTGDVVLTTAVMEIAAPFMQTGAPSQGTREAEAKNEKKTSTENTLGPDRGEKRSDLDRYAGLYGDPSEPNRKLFVIPSCDGYLVTGPMWADIAPWIMSSASENMFTYSDQYIDITLEFAIESGQLITMIHNIEGLAGTIERMGPLPEDWEPCLEMMYER